ncbi:Hypothetical protein MAU_4240 [Metamycoplasma auris 15026]|uniref:Uncharacterized protein n=1 Tax=Metamycoplasma auris 15026 TaxID=1188233 RepID=N9VAC8_9BACT|nr:hypothetical protein [Metamycoplasma auris]ENY68633.1 Hypothetical protein MAU_4240 [Metamycoplasma auris 15026]
MITLDGKRFWITYIALNISLLLVFGAVAFSNYSMLTGYIIGNISFLFFLLSLKLVMKLLSNVANNKKNKTKKEKKDSHIYFFTAFLIFLLGLLLNIGLFVLFIWINYFYHTKFDNSSNIAFFPFNTIAMTAPHLLLSVHVIIWGFLALIKNKKKKKGE